MSQSEGVVRSRPLRSDDPAGTPVYVVEDDGTVTQTRTRSIPWVTCHEVVLLEGRSGGFAVSRCSVPEAGAAHEPSRRHLARLDLIRERDELRATLREVARLEEVWERTANARDAAGPHHDGVSEGMRRCASALRCRLEAGRG